MSALIIFSMETIQNLDTIQKSAEALREIPSRKKLQKNYSSFSGLIIRKTMSEKRKETFGRDPLGLER
jgi:hypothetical protein